MFFDRETFGEDRLVVRARGGSWADFAAKSSASAGGAPGPRAALRGRNRLHAGPGARPTKKRRSRRPATSLFSGTSPRSIRRSRSTSASRTHGLYGMGIDGVPAIDCWGLGYPGFQGMGLSKGDDPRTFGDGEAEARGALHLPLPGRQRVDRPSPRAEPDPRLARREARWRTSSPRGWTMESSTAAGFEGPGPPELYRRAGEAPGRSREREGRRRHLRSGRKRREGARKPRGPGMLERGRSLPLSRDSEGAAGRARLRCPRCRWSIPTCSSGTGPRSRSSASRTSTARRATTPG